MDVFTDIGIVTIMEGVDTEKQYELVTENGVSFIQGYFLSKPLDEDSFSEFFKQQTKE